MNLDGRHPGTVALAQHFDFTHLPPQLQNYSRPCFDIAMHMIGSLPDSYQLTTGLQKLLEAKDAFVRAALEKS